MRYVLEFTVRGMGAFPIDMLRYDCCFPDTEKDSVKVMNPVPEWKMREITLRRYQEVKTLVPSLAKWEGCGWRVISKNLKQLY